MSTMQPHQPPTTHSAAGLSGPEGQNAIRAAAPWSVVAVKALPRYRLHVRFFDGSSGTVDLSRLIHAPDAGVFAPLKDEALFAQVRISYGAVTWPGDSPDLAPDAMHSALATRDEWVL